MPESAGKTHLGEVVAVCISPGGIPKRPVSEADVVGEGLVGDGRHHEKHRRPHRAVSIQDLELLEELRAEGFPVGPGVMGENLTVRGLRVQERVPGARLHLEGGPVLELTEPRKPCYVLDAVHPALKQAVVGRCGFLARVIQGGRTFPGQAIALVPAASPPPDPSL
jgi:MOSC domain-containing protein YiiM